ncbi:MAG: carbamoyltransferase [Bacteroidales bacterium]|nr:carbamoyltransferase [Bacteroidales bacterium]
MTETILGISAFYHDSAAAIICNGEIIAAAQEERFTRKKHDSSFPINAITYVLKESGIAFEDLDAIAFYDKPYIKFERLLETYHAFVPRGLVSFLSAIPVWIKEKIFMKKLLRDELKKFSSVKLPLLFPEHHLSHAASAFYPSPFNEAAILTIDGVGEWATTTLCHGKANQISIISELHFPHSVGLFYSAVTYYCGFRVNSGEYKLMGLAPYGDPQSAQKEEIKKKILENLVDIREDGSILMNMKYFNYATGLRMTHDKKWTALFGFPPRKPESELAPEYMNMALAVQEVLEEIIFRLAGKLKDFTGSKNLVLAGGVALNSVANGKLLKSGLFEDIWIQPAAGDAGGALGAALAAWYIWKGKERNTTDQPDSMKGACLGPEFNELQIVSTAKKYEAVFQQFDDFKELTDVVATRLNEGAVIGWFQGRMEYGPRALGNRSILGDARNPTMQKKMNLKIKFREGFRPFAPTVLEEDISEYFDLGQPSPYMMLVVPVKESRWNPKPEGYHQLSLRDKLYFQRSDIPAVTHIDYSARVQSINRNINPRYWELINAYKKLTGYGVIVNTSFNVRGEPIVCTPDDAYRCFMRTEMDYLVMENFLFGKKEQKEIFVKEAIDEFGLD